MLGPRTAADDAPLAKAAKAAKSATSQATEAVLVPAATSDGNDPCEMTFLGAAANFHAPGHNDVTENYLVTPNTKNLLAQHVARTGAPSPFLGTHPPVGYSSRPPL